MENSHQRHDEMIADYCDGQVYRQHPLFSRDPHALQIILYYDDVEVVNPLGSKLPQNIKLVMRYFYFTILSQVMRHSCMYLRE